MNSLDKFLLGQEGVVFLKCLVNKHHVIYTCFDSTHTHTIHSFIHSFKLLALIHLHIFVYGSLFILCVMLICFILICFILCTQAKVITQYINSLAGGKEAELEDKLLKAAAASEAASSMIKDLSITITANEPKKVLSNIVARKEEAARLEQQARSEALAKAALQEALENTEAVTKQHEELSNNWVSDI